MWPRPDNERSLSANGQGQKAAVWVNAKGFEEEQWDGWCSVC